MCKSGNLLNSDVKIAPEQDDIIRCLVEISSLLLISGILTVNVGTSLIGTSLNGATLIVS